MRPSSAARSGRGRVAPCSPRTARTHRQTLSAVIPPASGLRPPKPITQLRDNRWKSAAPGSSLESLRPLRSARHSPAICPPPAPRQRTRPRARAARLRAVRVAARRPGPRGAAAGGVRADHAAARRPALHRQGTPPPRRAGARTTAVRPRRRAAAWQRGGSRTRWRGDRGRRRARGPGRVLSTTDRPREAAVLIGAADARRGSGSSSRRPPQPPDQNLRRSLVRALGRSAFDEARTEGRSLLATEALRLTTSLRPAGNASSP